MRAQAAADDLTAAPRALRRSARNSQAPEAAPGGARALDALDDVALDVAIDLSAAAVAASPAPLSPEPDVAIARSAETAAFRLFGWMLPPSARPWHVQAA